MKHIEQLKVGQSLQIAGTVTVLKCGLHSQCGAAATPTVTLEIEPFETAAVPPVPSEPVAEETVEDLEQTLVRETSGLPNDAD